MCATPDLVVRTAKNVPTGSGLLNHPQTTIEEIGMVHVLGR